MRERKERAHRSLWRTGQIEALISCANRHTSPAQCCGSKPRVDNPSVSNGTFGNLSHASRASEYDSGGSVLRDFTCPAAARMALSTGKRYYTGDSRCRCVKLMQPPYASDELMPRLLAQCRCLLQTPSDRGKNYFTFNSDSSPSALFASQSLHHDARRMDTKTTDNDGSGSVAPGTPSVRSRLSMLCVHHRPGRVPTVAFAPG